MTSSQGSLEPYIQARNRVKPTLPHMPPPQEAMGLLVIGQEPQRFSWPHGRPWRPFSLLCSQAPYTLIGVILYPRAGSDCGWDSVPIGEATHVDGIIVHSYSTAGADRASLSHFGSLWNAAPMLAEGLDPDLT